VQSDEDDLGAENLVLAAQGVAGIGGTVLVESVSGPQPYPLRTAADTVAVVDRVNAQGADSFGWLPRDRRSAR
jgi:hydroxypyruvate isomerase